MRSHPFSDKEGASGRKQKFGSPSCLRQSRLIPSSAPGGLKAMKPAIPGPVSCGCLITWLGTVSSGALAATAGDLPRRPNAPIESYGKSDVIYDSVRDSRGERGRVIVTRPREGEGPFPAIFVAGWLSCDSVEAPAGTDDASGKVFRVLAELPGFVTVRFDKPGVGDSEGVCK